MREYCHNGCGWIDSTDGKCPICRGKKLSMSAPKRKVTLRPCESGKNATKAKFHRWVDHAYVIGPSIMIGGTPGGQVSATLALVEYEDGTIHEVEPTHIRFTDTEDNDGC